MIIVEVNISIAIRVEDVVLFSMFPGAIELRVSVSVTDEDVAWKSSSKQVTFIVSELVTLLTPL